MRTESDYFDLPLDSLRALGRWAADCAERALPVFEKYNSSDHRPRAAIEGIRIFAGGGKRTAELRRLALGALAAARDVSNPAAAAAARASGLAASSAYTHPLADIGQVKHILGPAAYAALALELDHGGDSRTGDGLIQWAIQRVSPEIRDLLMHMPEFQRKNSRLNSIIFELDVGVRNRFFVQNLQ